MQTTITKLEAATTLLNRAIELLLDRPDYLSATVLGGSAEDLLEDLLKRAGKHESAARAQMHEPLRDLVQRVAPDAPTLDPNGTAGILRKTFNWLRHNNRAREPQSIEVDLADEAVMVIERAIENLHWLTGEEHARVDEVVAFAREISLARG